MAASCSRIYEGSTGAAKAAGDHRALEAMTRLRCGRPAWTGPWKVATPGSYGNANASSSPAWPDRSSTALRCRGGSACRLPCASGNPSRRAPGKSLGIGDGEIDASRAGLGFGGVFSVGDRFRVSNPVGGRPRLSIALVRSQAPQLAGSLSGAQALGSRRASAGICYASQAIELLPSLYPEIVVRDARLEDCWEVADTHCSSFFPDYKFPLDLVLRIDRYIALLSGFSVPPGCMRTCLVAVNSNSVNNSFNIECTDPRDSRFQNNLSRGSIAGILTIDTVADYLPRRGPLKQRRTGIAYIANVAVRKEERQRGIARMLVEEAEARARSWGCRSIALHCDVNNLAALRLYKNQGFRCIRAPEGAKWPEPKIGKGVQYNFMMKRVPKL